MIASYDLAVLTEDSLPIDFTPERPGCTARQSSCGTGRTWS